jgi:hypothetical protein
VLVNAREAEGDAGDAHQLSTSERKSITVNPNTVALWRISLLCVARFVFVLADMREYRA